MKFHQLKYERERRGWSQAKVAEEIGADPLTVGRWERGTSRPSPYYRELLCALYKKNVEELGLVPINDLDSTTQDISSPIHTSPSTSHKPVFDPLMPVAMGDTSRLIGREAFLADLKHRVCTGRNRSPVALHGLPGIGKTALAMALAADSEIKTYFYDGILWAGLGTNPNVLSVLSRWGTLLGISSMKVKDVNSIQAWGKVLQAALVKRRMLLVIDDAWNLEDAEAVLVGGPNCACLLTTRHPEVAQAYSRKTTVRVPELSEADGLHLLARFVPKLVDQDLQIARHLVQQVGGHPLALTLIGKFLIAQVYSGQPRRLQRALEQMREAEQRLQVSMPTSLLERPPSLPVTASLSLSTVIAISDEHLSEQARKALRALSVFPAKPSSFSEEAAMAVAEVEVEALKELLNSGILERHSSGRYTLHQTLADYGKVHLEDQEAIQRLIDYYVHYLQAHQTETTAIEQESSNIHIALQEALARQQLDSLLILQVIPTIPVDDPVCLVLLPQTEKESADRQERDLQGMVMTSIYLGSEAWQHARYEQAETALCEAVQHAKKLGNLEQVPFCYGLLTMVERGRGNYPLAEYYHRECLQLAQQLGHEGGLSAAYAVEGLLAQEQGDYSHALEIGLHSEQLARQSNNSLLIYTSLSFLGATYFEMGNDEQAHRTFLEALEHARTAAHREGIAHVLSHLGRQAYRQGDYQQAEQYLQEGLLLVRQYEFRDYLGHLLLTSGLNALAQGKISQAEAFLQEGLDLARQIGNPLLRGRLLIGWSVLQRELGRLDTAEQALHEAIAKIPTVVRAMQAIAQYQLACVKAARGKLQEARELATSSLTTLETIGHREANQVRNALLEWSIS